MKKSAELKLKKAEKMRKLNAILDKAETENKRALTTEENTEYEAIKREVEDLNTQIERALFSEANPAEPQDQDQDQNSRHIQAPHVHTRQHIYSAGKALNEFARAGGVSGLTGLEKSVQEELSRGVSTDGILIPTSQRAVTDHTKASDAGTLDVMVDASLSVLGSKPLWAQMGCLILPDLKGSIKLPYKAAAVAVKKAEKAAIDAGGGNPSSVTLDVARFGVSDIFSKETLATQNPAVNAAIINDMIVGADRALTADIYATALAAATEVAGGALTPAGFNALMGAAPGMGAFAMRQSTFFEAKGVPIDAGSGRFLTELTAIEGIGASHDGAKVFYSDLFADGGAAKYILYAIWSAMAVGTWGAIEVLVNPYTYQKEGQVELTVNRLANDVVRNANGFKKSPNLGA